jgi:hypothetical protein
VTATGQLRAVFGVVDNLRRNVEVAAAAVAVFDGHDGGVAFAAQQAVVAVKQIGFDDGDEFLAFAVQLGEFFLDEFAALLQVGSFGLAVGRDVFELRRMSFSALAISLSNA